jgi:hypothetical protein
MDLYTHCAYTLAVEFIETPLFTELVSGYLGDDDYRNLQRRLALDPEAGDVIRGTGGFRKLRWRDTRRGKGKRGGLRVIYYYLVGDSQIWLFTIYGKGEVEDLSSSEKRALKAAIEEETRRRSRRRSARR